jgi:hypothetical protein
MIESSFELRTFGSDIMLNHQLCQKLKLIEIGKFNHLINTLTLPLTCGLKLIFNRRGPTHRIFNWNGEWMIEIRFELKTFGYNTMLNYHLSQKLKLIGRGKINYLITTLTASLTCWLKLNFNSWGSTRRIFNRNGR